MLDERPTAPELLSAVADFLEQHVRPALDGRLSFHTKVAVNALRIVIRELTADPPTAELARLRALTGAGGDLHTLNTVLAQQIRDGTLSTSDDRLRDHLVRSVLYRIAVDNPRYPSLAEAARRWSHGVNPW
jgi:hypothetical protein